MESFLQDMTYVSGQYNERGSYEALHDQLRTKVCPSTSLDTVLLLSGLHRAPIGHGDACFRALICFSSNRGLLPKRLHQQSVWRYWSHSTCP